MWIFYFRKPRTESSRFEEIKNFSRQRSEWVIICSSGFVFGIYYPFDDGRFGLRTATRRLARSLKWSTGSFFNAPSSSRPHKIKIRISRCGFFVYWCIFDRGVINSVGSECYLDRVEVTGSNPVWPTSSTIPMPLHWDLLFSRNRNLFWLWVCLNQIKDSFQRHPSRSFNKDTGLFQIYIWPLRDKVFEAFKCLYVCCWNRSSVKIWTQ